MKGGLFTCLAETVLDSEDSETTGSFGLYLSSLSFAAAVMDLAATKSAATNQTRL